MTSASAVATSCAATTADLKEFASQFARVNDAILARANELAAHSTNSTAALIEKALGQLPKDLPQEGLGLEKTVDLLLAEICPALAPGQAGPRWYGLITGGATSAAHLADNLVTSYDPNVQVHNPEETIATVLEQLTLSHLLTLLSLPAERFTHNTFTTGATASNILGLALGRDHVVSRIKGGSWSVPEDGFGGVQVEVLVTGAHASILKAASLTGIGRKNVVDLTDEDTEEPCDFDLVKLEARLQANESESKGTIVVSSAGEVNTGGWTSHISQIRTLCDRHGAWLHIDSAFAMFASVLPEFKDWAADLALADSICSDAHKWLNVPYDCGLFFSRSSRLIELLGPGKNSPAYLQAGQASDPATRTEGGPSHRSATPHLDPYRSMPSPLFMNIENSRRFRALPVYASLISLGKTGYASLFAGNIAFARRIAAFLSKHQAYDLLTPSPSNDVRYRQINIVLFAPSRTAAPERFRSEDGANLLRDEINRTRLMHCTGTKWRGRAAIRIAVSNWMTSEERDWEIVQGVLERVMSG